MAAENLTEDSELTQAARVMGRKGGRVTLEKYGIEHYASLGHTVGTKIMKERGSEYFRSIAQTGGAVTAERFGHHHYVAQGTVGGNKLKARLQAEMGENWRDYYRDRGKRAAASPNHPNNRRRTDPIIS